MPILPFEGKYPQIDPSAFIAPTATVVGDVTIEAGASVWFGSVVRGDFQPVRIGKNSNVQDNATVHVMGDTPTEIGDNVTIGHNAIIHCRKIGNDTLIGMGSLLLGYSEIGANCVIGAGSFISQHKKIPANSLAYGNPAKLVRSLRDDEMEAVTASALHYSELGKTYKEIVAANMQAN